MRHVLIVIGILITNHVICQDVFKSVGAGINYGSIIIHSQDLRVIKDSYPIGFEIDYSRHNISEKAWNSCNCYPKSGISIGFWDFDNQEVLGYGLTTMYYLQPVFGAGNKFSFSVRAGLGLSYQSKPYNSITNPDNMSYSTYVAFPLQLGLASHYKFASKWMIELNLVYNHISNGGMKEPNKGINWPSVGLGVSRYFQEPAFPERVKKNWRNDNPDINRFDLNIFGTYHQPYAKFYLISGGLEFKYARRIGRINNLTGGAEWMYDNGKAYYSTNELPVNGNNLGLGIGNEFILGKFLFGQQFAVYLIKPITQSADFYQRYSLVFRINSTFFTGVSLKAHGHVADFADIRVGYSF